MRLKEQRVGHVRPRMWYHNDPWAFPVVIPHASAALPSDNSTSSEAQFKRPCEHDEDFGFHDIPPGPALDVPEPSTPPPKRRRAPDFIPPGAGTVSSLGKTEPPMPPSKRRRRAAFDRASTFSILQPSFTTPTTT
ncbi:hypothetical protein EK21DRAFT_85592 [Setomelanomma holmii]|uniref:Uncharacterized protein n=1 Tax=Setomelanomma holmii TaxID=210430 RepID=A0A9P4LQE3_9PLEO|nr:hypothetical protein EK21DRAFT_85592 [Setomelanomma holmii]